MSLLLTHRVVPAQRALKDPENVSSKMDALKHFPKINFLMRTRPKWAEGGGDGGEGFINSDLTQSQV